jgi:hypothetical protein
MKPLVRSQPGSPAIATTNTEWPPSTPQRRRTPTPQATPSYGVSPFPSPVPQPESSPPHPGSAQDDDTVGPLDPAPDSESDAWTTDDDVSSATPSRSPGGRPYPRARIQRSSRSSRHTTDWHDLMGEYEPNTDALRDTSLNGLLDEVSGMLAHLREVLDSPPNPSSLSTQRLMDFQYDTLSVLILLSEHGLMDRVFDADPSGMLRHQSLLVLRMILGRYYPSVAPTNDDRAEPGPNDPVGPASTSSRPTTDLGSSLRIFSGSRSLGDPSPPLAPTKSQARRQRRARAKLASASRPEDSMEVA